ncbi:hypothetical protein [Streptomyces pinistramenti]|uniref:hypothetical protein n=1 Tax=Streptomyces pinistramenti TaxID=2884812 RepID=UPI001D06DBAB|nr:hypothetical protein [Streptomyces pinistramenti]MCB5906511.1 hypothetical protein [Streptomyces pinistramenti]
MRTVDSSPGEAAEPAPPTGSDPQDGHQAAVAAVAQHINTVISPLRELDLAETWPDGGHGTGRGAADASL